MSNIDDKPSDIDAKLRTLLTNNMYLDETVGAIKQAFADEGYITPQQVEKTQELVNQMANLAQDMARQPVAAMADFSKGKLSKLMTGQDWYDRFEKELYKPKPQERIKHNDDGESHDRFFRAGGSNFMYGKALEAAKRASGVK